jgi:ABC-type oligopeptide transport system substrate-binding subunit/ABC-type branched-subunit amino acid transport system substrate-binding protein
MKKKQNFVFFLFLTALTLLTACDVTSEQRAKRAAEAQGDIFIAIVQTSLPSNFLLEGVRMAIEEINQQGGLLGRKLVSVVYYDKGDPAEAERIARKISKNKNIIAVIGHRKSSAAIPASIIYEQAGILFISYGANAPGLTQYSVHYTFRNIPTDNDYGRAMAEFIHNKGLKKTMVFHDREMTQRNLADIFKKEALAKGIEIAATRSYFNADRDFKELVNSLKKEEGVDSLALFGLMPAGAYLLKELDEMGVELPIFGSGGLDYPDLFTIAGNSAEGVTIPTVFNPLYPDKQTRTFVNKFQDQFNLTPDKWAAQGYDAVSLLAHTIKESETTKPSTLASHLRFTEKWHGVTGSYSFILQGDIKDKEIFFKKVHNGKFVFDTEQAGKSDLLNYIEDLTLRLPLKEPVTTLDPGLVSNESDAEIAEQLFLGLTGLDPKTNEPIPELARQWERNKLVDTLYYFTLREDITWTDGEPVTAHDVIRAIKRNLDPKTASPQVEELFILKNAQDISLGKKKKSELGVYAAEDFALVFELEYPDPFFPARVSLPVFRPLPKSVLEQDKEEWTNLDIIRTNGPYRPVEWQQDIGIFLKKNQKYFAADKVSVPEVRYLVVAQPPVGLAMYENNELDIMGGKYLPLPVAALSGIRLGPLHDEYYKAPTACTYTYVFNTELPPFDRPLVRKAISAAIDRQTLIDAVNSGAGEAAASCTPPILSDTPSVDTASKIIFDPEQAEKWLAEAGYPNGEGFPELTLVTEQSETDKKIAQGIQTLLKHLLHISVTVTTKKRTGADAVAYDESAHMAMLKVCSDYPSPDGVLKKLRKKTNWTNNAFDQLIKNARNLTGTEERQEAYKKADQIICQEEAAVIPIFYEISPVVIKSKVQGWHHATMGGQRLDQCFFKEHSY